MQVGLQVLPGTRSGKASALQPKAAGGRVIQRASVSISTQQADEASAVVAVVTFKTRPPVNSDVQRVVSINNHNQSLKGGPKWHVGHKVGWDLIKTDYRRKFEGRTIQSIYEEMKSLGYPAVNPTIRSAELHIGMWADKDYKASYADNEFPQEAVENTSSGGSVPHLRSDFEDGYKKGLHSTTDNDQQRKKRKLIDAQVTFDPKASEESKKSTLEKAKSSWNRTYMDSPIREGDMDF